MTISEEESIINTASFVVVVVLFLTMKMARSKSAVKVCFFLPLLFLSLAVLLLGGLFCVLWVCFWYFFKFSVVPFLLFKLK